MLGNKIGRKSTINTEMSHKHRQSIFCLKLKWILCFYLESNKSIIEASFTILKGKNAISFLLINDREHGKKIISI